MVSAARRNHPTLRVPLQRRGIGFTLIELSIVLVILGLIVGGIVGGRSLIRAAELQSLIREYSSWKTAYNAFVLQYDAKPGDMRDAWDYFGGGVNTNCGTNSNSFSNGCNGNGDNIIGNFSTSNTGRAERQRVWIHLQMAEIISGKVQYRHGVTEYQFPAPTYRNGAYWNNLPIAKAGYGDAGWEAATPRISGITTIYGKSGLWWRLVTLDDTSLEGGVLAPKEAYSIDKKIDDGIPTLGNITSVRGAIGGDWSAQCSSNDMWDQESFNYYGIPDNTASASDVYTLTTTEPACSMFFYNGDY